MTVSFSAINVQARTCGQPARRRATLATYFSVWKQRRELANLDAARLKDLGILPAQAAAEAARPVWDLPCDHHD